MEGVDRSSISRPGKMAHELLEKMGTYIPPTEAETRPAWGEDIYDADYGSSRTPVKCHLTKMVTWAKGVKAPADFAEKYRTEEAACVILF